MQSQTKLKQQETFVLKGFKGEKKMKNRKLTSGKLV